MESLLPFVSIIIVNYNGRDLLQDCFNSLTAVNYPESKLEIIMVDNASSDTSIEFIKDHYPKVKIIRNEINNYCFANNLAIKQISGELIALINNDVLVDKEWLMELVEVIKQNENIGAVASKILFLDGRIQGTGHYEFPDFYWSDRGFKEENKGQYNKIEDIKSFSHCSVLYRKKCIDEIGLLDEDFGMYLEDVDMSVRARQKGWRLVYVPKSIVYHKFHGSVKEEAVPFYCERNRLLLVAKHYPQELGFALFGKGYFTALNNRDSLIKILPDVFNKLLKTHGIKTTVSVLPGIFENLNKILGLEKDYLIKQLDLKDNELNLIRNSIQQRNGEISILRREIANSLDIISQKDQVIQQKNSEISGFRNDIANSLSIISQKGQAIINNNQEINKLNSHINAIYSSKTYRFIAMPIWKILDALKKPIFKPKAAIPNEALVIKPYIVGIDETKMALAALKNIESKQNIVLVANLFEHEYPELVNNGDIYEKIFYCPQRNRLNIKELFKLILRIRFRKFRQIILLVGKPSFGEYIKGKLLIVLSGAKNKNIYSIERGRIEPLCLYDGCKAFLAYLFSYIALFCVVSLFIIFVAIPLKLSKIFKR